MEKLDLSKWEDNERKHLEALIEILSDDSRTQLENLIDLLKVSPSGLGNSEHIVQPTLFAHIAFGNAGLKAIQLLFIQNDLGPGTFYAPVALMAVALGNHKAVDTYISLAQRYLSDDAFLGLKRDIYNVINNEISRKYAIQLIASAAKELAIDPQKRGRLTSIFNSISIVFAKNANGENPAIDLFLRLMVQGSLSINEFMVEEFRDLIDQDHNEKIYQEFISTHPALIDPLASSIVDRKVLGEMWRSDFVIRRLDDEYIFVELEKPKDNPFIAYPQPSERLSHAIAQIINWFIWIEDNIAYAQSHGFPNILNPRGVIVIGRRKDLTPPQARMLSSLNDLLNPRIKIYTYDDLLQNAENVINNITNKDIVY